MQTKVSLKCEGISAQCTASARGIAKLAAYMANGGSLNGKQLLKPETCQEMISEPTEQLQDGKVNSFTKGGMCQFKDKHKMQIDQDPTNIFNGKMTLYF